MIHPKCWDFKRLRGALLPGFTLGPLHFADPMLLCGALFLLFRYDAGGWLRLSLLASVLHEAGHIAAYGLLLHKLPYIDVNLTGFCMHTARLLLPPLWELGIAAAGPGANLLAVIGIFGYTACGGEMTLWLLGFFWANLLISGFNLLPIPPLDGYTLLALARAQLQLRRK